MDAEGITRTTRGRVVYDREKHNFRHRDLNRVARAVGYPTDDVGRLWYYLTLSEMIAELTKWLPEDVRDCADEVRLTVDAAGREILESGSYKGFSGGEFGGAGSTRDIHWPWEGNPFKP